MRDTKVYKGKLSLYVTLLVVVVIAMFMLRNCSSPKPTPSNTLSNASGGDTIDVAIEISPLAYSMATDTVGGFQYDMLRLIASEHNLKLKFHEFVPLKYALDGLDNGTFDIVVADIPSTTEFKEKYLLTEPVYLDRQVLVQRKDSLTGVAPISSQHQLAADTIWVVAGSPFISRIRNLSQEIGCDTIYIEQNAEYSSEILIIMTALGEIKQAVVNEKIAKAMLRDYPQIDINTKISFTQFQSWALNHSNPTLLDSLNLWIAEFKTSPAYTKLLSRYFK